MSVWFDGSSVIRCDLDEVKRSFDDLGSHYVGVVGLMPGISSAVLVEHGPDSVVLRTNEGLMRRSHITTDVSPDRLIVEFEEEYVAGSRVTATSRFRDEFTRVDGGVLHRTVVRDVEASGILGFLYRTFGSSSMGKAFLGSYQTYFEQGAD